MPRIPARLRRQIIEGSQARCAYCHSPQHLMGVEFEVDHILPRAAGGKTVADNLCLSCPTCNRYKATRSTALDPLTRQTVQLFHPNRDRWSDHFAWGDDSTRLQGLTPVGRATLDVLHINRTAMLTLRRYWRATGIQWADSAHDV
jgi:hypothetical protein